MGPITCSDLQTVLLFLSLALLGCLYNPCSAKIHIVFLRIYYCFLSTRISPCLSSVLIPYTHAMQWKQVLLKESSRRQVWNHINDYSTIYEPKCKLLTQWRVFKFIFYFLFTLGGGGCSPYWVHSERRPLLAYCTCPGWLWGWRSWWNEWFWQGKRKYSEITCPDATLSTTNPTCKTRAATVGSQRLTAWIMARLPWRLSPSGAMSSSMSHSSQLQKQSVYYSGYSRTPLSIFSAKRTQSPLFHPNSLWSSIPSSPWSSKRSLSFRFTN
jgi:hypothetical protein